MTYDAQVLVVGAGPTGMTLAAELRLQGVPVTVLERDLEPTPQVRSLGLHARTLEVLAMRGILPRFLDLGTTYPVGGVFAGVGAGRPLELAGRHAHVLGIPQTTTDRLLEEWAVGLGADLRRGAEVVAIAQDDAGVDVTLADGSTLRAAYVVGCDGGRSTVRRLLGIGFPGEPARSEWLLTEAEVGVNPEEVTAAMAQATPGRGGVGPAPHAPGTYRVVLLTDEVAPRDAPPPTLDDVRAQLHKAIGTDLGLHSPRFVSRFGDATRLAERYRDGRVLLAGDAAHVHPPTGGQGIGLGVGDAVNLGWKLAQVVRGVSPAGLLDSYQAERHPATARVLRNVMAQALLQRGDPRTNAMRETISDLLTFDGPRAQLAGLLSGLDVRYDLGEGHPLLGRRMPDLDLATAEGRRRVFELLHDARPVLLDLGEPGSIDLTAWAGRVRHVHAEHTGPWQLPVVGAVTAPVAVLIRPDGHVAWVGDGTQTGLTEALTTWFGRPAKTAVG
jgi:3-(3-hydroxy-phenyl)propionate hydroxylase